MFRSLCAILFAVVLGLMPSATAADSSCDPHRTPDSVHRFSGWYELANGAHYVSAIKATLEQQTGFVAPGGTSRFWILLTDGVHFVQAGFNHYEGQVSQDFWGTFDVGDPFEYTHSLGKLTPNDGTATFEIRYVPSLNEYDFFRNGSYLGKDTFPGYFYGYGEVMAETFGYDDQMYGGTADQADATNIKYQIDGSTTWQTFGASSYTTRTFYNSSQANYGGPNNGGVNEAAGHLWTWDKKCP